jgi:nucleotide-binding universal stress UspA family protein
MYTMKILVPVSFSPQSDHALRQAIYISKCLDAMVTCLHVIEKPGLLAGLRTPGTEDQQVKREAELRLSSRVNQLFSDHKDVAFELIVSSGKVYRNILDKASVLRADMIIMGRSDSTYPNKHFLGSNTLKVISRAHVPVISVRSGRTDKPRHFLLPLDLGKKNQLKISTALKLCGLLGARVTVCHVLEGDPDHREDEFKRKLASVRKVFDDSGILCNTAMILAENQISDEILSYALDVKADMILMMTQQENESAGVYFGSTAHDLIRISDVPVLSINPLAESIRALLEPSRGKAFHKTGKFNTANSL